MKKIIIQSLICFILVAQFLGCSIKKSESDIRKIAYNYLSNEEKETISEWENASVERIRYSSKHVINKNSKLVNIENIDTYKVTLTTDLDDLLGPIIVYISYKTHKVLGVDLRY